MVKKLKKSAPTVEPVADAHPLLQYIDDLVDALRALIPKAFKEWNVDAVHQARVSTRRLKAAIDLLEPVLTPAHHRAFGKVLKKLRRQLGPLRDLDVMLDHLKGLAGDPRLIRSVQWGAAAFEDQRKEERDIAAKKVSISNTLSKLGRWWGLREEVVEAKEAVDTLVKQSVHLQLDGFIEQADLLAAKELATAVAARGGAGEIPNADLDPHALRIVGKKLRYTLEMAAGEGYELGSVQKTFKQMQECLGLWHDFIVLGDRLLSAAIDRQLSHHDPRLQDELLEVSRSVLRRATKELDRFVKLWCDKGEALAKSLRHTFPLTTSIGAVEPAPLPKPVSESQTDPDPTDSPEPSAPRIDPESGSPDA